MNRQDRIKIKNAVICALEAYAKPLSLPLPIKAVTKSWPNVRLIPYSKQMQRRNFSYREMLNFAGTEDACTDYDAETGRYVIYYNNIDKVIMSSYRYRWNIAHELGHVTLNHHKNYQESRIYRNSLSKALYAKLETEADMFAAYILVPHIILDCIGVQNENQIVDTCRISGEASKYRVADLTYWRRRGRCEQYDFELLNLFSSYIESNSPGRRMRGWLNRHRRCCHCAALLPIEYSYCKICGAKAYTTYKLEVPQMTFGGIEIDTMGRALECPVRHNTDLFKDGTFCIICGCEIVNICSESVPNNNYRPLCDHSDPLPGNARYCPYCGAKTTFFANQFLPSWNEENYVEVDDPGDLPF